MNLQRGASHTITKFGVVGFSSLIVSSPDPTLSFLAGRRAWGGHESTLSLKFSQACWGISMNFDFDDPLGVKVY